MKRRVIITVMLLLCVSTVLFAAKGVKKGVESKTMTKEINQDGGTIKVFNVSENKYQEVSLVVRSEEEWKKVLDKNQFHITREHGTERAFSGEYWDNKKKGIYKCVACGTDLFHSDTKFKSGTGWPSYYEPVAQDNVGTQMDNSFFMQRTEVHCARCKSHLGHIFPDGPPPTGQRYCINSASLTFVEGQEYNKGN